MAEDQSPEYGNLSSPATQVFSLVSENTLHLLFVDEEALERRAGRPMTSDELIQCARYIFSLDLHGAHNFVAIVSAAIHNALDEGLTWRDGKIADPPPYEEGTRIRIWKAYHNIPQDSDNFVPPTGKMWDDIGPIIEGL